jgi:hypothetical protein
MTSNAENEKRGELDVAKIDPAKLLVALKRMAA